MEFIHEFQYTINIKSPCSYIVNEEENTRKELIESFTKKCYKGYYIVEILDILQISDARHIYSNSEGTFALSVIFTALVRRYVSGDILPMADICIKKQQTIGITDDAILTIVESKNNNVLQEKMKVPLQVCDKIVYNTNNENIWMTGSMLLPINPSNNIVFKLVGSLPLKNDSRINKYIKLIVEQESELKTKESKYFTNLLNTYKKIDIKSGQYDLIQLLSNEKEEKIIDGFWMKELRNSSDKCKYNHSKNYDGDYIEITHTEAFLRMLHSCYNTRKGIIEMGKIYKNDMLKNNDSIWELMLRQQL